MSDIEIVVVGIGAMGGGMARALLSSPLVGVVCGYDKSTNAVNKFYEESKQVNKSSTTPPASLKEAVSSKANFVILSLVNESQCQQVCFGGSNSEASLFDIMPQGSCLILTSTVTATWAKMANKKFRSKNINFVDCPVSGGPARALAGELTLMASGDDDCIEESKPILNILGKEVHIICGGAGAGSTVKCVHQLLAGVHICAAAEAMAMAAKAGLDVEQLYRIVNGAAGASWMFNDRGKRMLEKDCVEVKSALDIFVKDLDIVYSEAKTMKSPIPVASAALQQFISGQSMGLGRKDDSQVVKVYESITGVPVGKKNGKSLGDYARLPDGTTEKIMDMTDEPMHHLVLSNDYARIFDARIPAQQTTQCHRHSEDSLFIFLSPSRGMDMINYIQGSETPNVEYKDCGEVSYSPYKTEQYPLIHKVKNGSKELARILDVEFLDQPPITVAGPMDSESHELVKTTNRCRVYKLSLDPGRTVTVSYPFFHTLVVLTPSEIEIEIATQGNGKGGIRWIQSLVVGNIQWKEPVIGMKQRNVGDSTFEQYIVEWR